MKFRRKSLTFLQNLVELKSKLELNNINTINHYTDFANAEKYAKDYDVIIFYERNKNKNKYCALWRHSWCV